MSEATVSPEDVLVKVQDTPNPYAIKFIVNQELKTEGNATFNSAEECGGLVLPEALLNLLGVKQIYFFENTVTVTHDGSLPTEDLKEYVEAVLKTRVPVHNPNFEVQSSKADTKKEKVDRSNLSEELKSIEEVLDRTIRPGLQADGGDVEVLSLEDNVLKILYMGACGGCPSAMMGTLEAIQGILRNELVNDELIVVPT